jgi:hypothetical protein
MHEYKYWVFTVLWFLYPDDVQGVSINMSQFGVWFEARNSGHLSRNVFRQNYDCVDEA